MIVMARERSSFSSLRYKQWRPFCKVKPVGTAVNGTMSLTFVYKSQLARAEGATPFDGAHVSLK